MNDSFSERMGKLTRRAARKHVSPAGRHTLLWLHFAQRDNPLAWPSQDVLSEQTGYDRKTVRAALGELARAGLVDPEELGRHAYGYRVVDTDADERPRWTSPRTRRTQAVPPTSASGGTTPPRVDERRAQVSGGTTPPRVEELLPPNLKALETGNQTSPQTPLPGNRSRGAEPPEPPRASRVPSLRSGGVDEAGGLAPRAPAPVGRIEFGPALDVVDVDTMGPDSDPAAIKGRKSKILADALRDASRGTCAVTLDHGSRAAHALERLPGVDVAAMRTLGSWLLPSKSGGGDGARGMQMGVPTLRWMLVDTSRLLERIERAQNWEAQRRPASVRTPVQHHRPPPTSIELRGMLNRADGPPPAWLVRGVKRSLGEPCES